VSEKKEDCPVEEATCIARMATLDERIKGIIRAVYVSGATVTLILAAVTFALKLWRP
jgi:hypothetical protein